MAEPDDGWATGTTVEDWHALNKYADGFHDAVIKECYILQNQHVNDRGDMVYGDDPVVALLIQSQDREVAAIELHFGGVRSLSFDREREVEPSEVVPTHGGDLTFRVLSCVVQARAFRWRSIGPEAWGPSPFLRPATPD